ncbi:hypothetical protein Acid345_3516 [Candidatus Koribacter versatilis Ellin345]|uniref:D-glucuronyl C5-epimerase C-terminal domain-containing protein n=1 Tax=Koribacter versatilis (strain Ellin345) TaxID=204669 RepID=Q1IKT3_KORVE|nr:D-glucuronyl C5-epimerase family protein [Candidatus Koribacter versatilis]ABF42517.1 hypothetical protein Acid345_3516 [Candidatus Koribacter versatilis Ellin345]
MKRLVVFGLLVFLQVSFTRVAHGQCVALGTVAPVTTYSAAGVYLSSLTDGNIAHGSNIQFDGNGIPMVLASGVFVYNPVTVSQWALQQYSYSVAYGTAGAQANLVKGADWLMSVQDATTGIWYINYSFTVAGMGVTLSPPWGGAMAQGQAISVLSRAYQVTHDEKYLTAASKALAPLAKKVSEGGLTDDFFGDPNLPHYEEYPTVPASYTLNGFMFTLVGLYDLSAFDATALSMYNAGLKTLDAELPYHEMGGISAYHLGHITNAPRGPHVAWSYHLVHLQLLGALKYLNPTDKVVSFYYGQWCSYQRALSQIVLSPASGTTFKAGQLFYLNAQINPNYAIGFANLTDGGTPVSKATLGNGRAIFRIDNPTAGTHNYQVSYTSDGTVPSVTSNVLSITVTP